ncbi:hypothetical protein N7539_003756 [Penicillium diatomitis]|uniref:Uncharacterized protein n=1 Tax=Penicillium diatomitis TaxID=2819901 RepID=A0A9W9XCX5_9EURO|nr:uncharacterized protein N7539_003756 [Penicillium diatomitis]KAJ5488866.1 hypothetical protein N7539_003756 [Penicillium diatomitis]
MKITTPTPESDACPYSPKSETPFASQQVTNDKAPVNSQQDSGRSTATKQPPSRGNRIGVKMLQFFEAFNDPLGNFIDDPVPEAVIAIPKPQKCRRPDKSTKAAKRVWKLVRRMFPSRD